MVLGLGHGLTKTRPVGGSGIGSLTDATWENAYSATVSYNGLSGAVTVTGLPPGLSGSASGGVLTISGTPK